MFNKKCMHNIFILIFAGKAGSPNFKSSDEGTEKHTYSLEWVVESKTPVISFRLEYREDDGDRSYLLTRRPKSYYGYTTVGQLRI